MMASMKTHVSISDPLPDPLVDAIAARFRVIGEPMRLRLLDRLRHGEASVGELAAALGASQQNISRHLSVFALCETACGSLYETVAGLAELLEPTIHPKGAVR